MAEQISPAPSTSRGIYGFVIFLLFTTLMVLYVLWAFVPKEFYEFIGVTELPNKYFALFIPIVILTATTIFAFFVYPTFSFIMTTDLDSIHTITDSSSIKRCQHRGSNGKMCDKKIIAQFDSWNATKDCTNHENPESSMSGHCDCVDLKKCMLANNKKHIEVLRSPTHERQNSAGDLDISYVSQVLYGKAEGSREIY